MGGKWNRWETPIADYIENKRVVRKEYNQWAGMYNRAVVGDKDRFYDNVDLSDMFCSYDLWVEWAREQIGFLATDDRGVIWSIDKDIVGDGSIYSEDVCVFVPQVINNLYRKKQKNTTELGECIYHNFGKKGRYKVLCFKFGKQQTVGYSDSLEQCIVMRDKFRLSYLDDLYQIYRDRLDVRVFDCLYDRYNQFL